MFCRFYKFISFVKYKYFFLLFNKVSIVMEKPLNFSGMTLEDGKKYFEKNPCKCKPNEISTIDKTTKIKKGT